MTDKLREAAQAALEALYAARGHVAIHRWPWQRIESVCHEAIQRLRAALAEQDAEPVAWRWKLFPDGMWHYGDAAPPPPYKSFSLYTHHPRREWQSLTRDEIADIALDCYAANGAEFDDFKMAERIEAALREKNHE